MKEKRKMPVGVRRGDPGEVPVNGGRADDEYNVCLRRRTIFFIEYFLNLERVHTSCGDGPKKKVPNFRILLSFTKLFFFDKRESTHAGRS